MAENARTRTPTLDDGDGPFSREEAQAIFQSLEDYERHSRQYQDIIRALEDRVKDLEQQGKRAAFEPGRMTGGLQDCESLCLD